MTAAPIEVHDGGVSGIASRVPTSYREKRTISKNMRRRAQRRTRYQAIAADKSVREVRAFYYARRVRTVRSRRSIRSRPASTGFVLGDGCCRLRGLSSPPATQRQRRRIEWKRYDFGGSMTA